MNIRIAALSVLAAINLQACALGGHAPQFRKPEDLGPKITVTEAMLADHEFLSTDQKGTAWIRPAADKSLTAGGNGRTYEKEGRWWVENGNFCIEGKTWWLNGGNCYELFGESIETVERWHPTGGDFTYMYMPFRRTR